MSAYNDAVAYLDAEMHPRCDYDIYSDMRNIVDEMEAENAKLRELVAALADCRNTTCDDCVRWDYPEGGCSLDGVMRELGVDDGTE